MITIMVYCVFFISGMDSGGKSYSVSLYTYIFSPDGTTDEPWESTPGKELQLAIGKESRLNLAERRDRQAMHHQEWRG